MLSETLPKMFKEEDSFSLLFWFLDHFVGVKRQFNIFNAFVTKCETFQDEKIKKENSFTYKINSIDFPERVFIFLGLFVGYPGSRLGLLDYIFVFPAILLGLLTFTAERYPEANRILSLLFVLPLIVFFIQEVMLAALISIALGIFSQVLEVTYRFFKWIDNKIQSAHSKIFPDQPSNHNENNQGVASPYSLTGLYVAKETLQSIGKRVNENDDVEVHECHDLGRGSNRATY